MQLNRGLELILVAAIVVLAAFYARAEYIPPYADKQVEIAAEKYDLDIEAPGEWFSAWVAGDGVAFAVIAADPTGMKLATEVKEPAYRFTRAGFGWMAAAASLGQEPWVPYGMAIIGAMSLGATVLLAIRLRERIGPKTWLLLLNPAIYLGFAGDTAEPLGLLLLAYALATGSIWASALLGVTRPSFMTALIGRWRQLGIGMASVGVVLLYGFIRFGPDQFVPDGGRIGVPFASYLEHSSLSGWTVAILGTATLIVGAKSKDWAWVLSGLLVVCLGSDVLADPINAWRAAGALPVLWAFGPLHQAAVKSSEVSPIGSPVGVDT